MSGRIRTIKPELNEDDKTASLDDHTWRLFVGLLVLADDHGCMRGAAEWLHAQVFWRFPDAVEKTRESLATLARESLVTLYEVSGQRYLMVTNWSKHQKVDHPSKPRVPQPKDGVLVGESDDSRGSREGLDGNPENLAPRARAQDPDPDPEEEGEGDRATPPPPADSVIDSDRETLCPLDLADTFGGYPEMAAALGASEGALRDAAGEFVTYWTLGAGVGRKRSHWARRLRQDLLRKAELGKLGGGPPERARATSALAAVRAKRGRGAS